MATDMGTDPRLRAYRRRSVRWAALTAGAVGVVVAVGLGAGGAERPAAPVLPDLDQAAPYGVSVQRREGRYVLAFGSAVDNLGRGALTIEARRPGRAPQMDATQLVRRSDGSVERRRLGPILRYERAETHSHWHLHRFARYELRRASDRRLALRAIKQGFCLGDRYDADRGKRRPGEPAKARWTHECGRGEPGRQRLVQGISPGYGDDYAPYLEGQHFPLRGLRAGRYVLVQRVNPYGVLREVRTANNASSVLLELRRPAGRAPLVLVLERCPDSARCAT
jgi:hypothetical protein